MQGKGYKLCHCNLSLHELLVTAEDVYIIRTSALWSDFLWKKTPQTTNNLLECAIFLQDGERHLGLVHFSCPGENIS